MTTISASSTIGIYLSPPSYTGAVVINRGVVLTGDFGGFEIYGNPSTWTIINSGLVEGSNAGVGGIHLQAGGVVTNETIGIIGLPGRNPSAIYIVGGAGTVINYGVIDAGVWLQTGGAVTNQTGGRIISSSASGYGVGLHAGGTVTNAGQISGLYFGIDAGVGGGTVTNQAGGRLNGQIFGVEMGFPGQVAGGGGNLTNEAGGTISGDSGFIAAGSAATVNNAGAIMGTFAGTVSAHGYIFLSGAGVSLSTGGTVTNQSGGGITGASYGVYITGRAGTVMNSGSIAGNPIASSSISAGIDLIAGGVVTNQSGGRITGYNGIYAEYGSSTTKMTVVNSGSINGNATFGDGVYLGIGGRVTNQSGGSISGYHGVSGQVLTVVNYGSIAGNLTPVNVTFDVGAGVELHAGGAVTNQSDGAISGRFAVISDPTTDGPALTTATVVNAGNIAGNSAGASYFGAGVVVGSGGSVTNQSGATISGFIGVYGLKQAPMALVTAVNAGVILGNTASASVTGAFFDTPLTVKAAGVYLAAGGSFTNQTGATISGYGGIVAGTIAAATVVNAGTISGIGTAVGFGAGVANRLVIDPGAVFGGTVNGGNTIGATAVSTLELTSAASAGTLSGLGSKYIDFAQATIDSGATWQLAGTNTLAAGATITNAGTLILSGATLTGGGTLNNVSGGVTIDPSTMTIGNLAGTGLVTIDSGSTFTVTGTVAPGETIVFAGTAAVLNILDPAGFAGTIQGKGPSDQVNAPPTSYVWTGAQNTNFANAFNWDDVTDSTNPATAPPGVLDTAEFLATGGTVAGIGTVAVLQFGSGGLWALGSGARLISETGITVGNGMLAVDGGASIASEGTVDAVSGSGGMAASVTVAGTNAAWSSAGNLIVGDDGIGNLAIQADGTVVSDAAIIANQSGAGGSSVNVTGAGSDWQIAGALDVGNAATGVLAITNGASVSVTTLDVGDQASGAGIVTISGPNADLVTTGTVTVGDSGSGELSILDGANANIGGDLNVANTGSGTGNVDIEDTTGTITFGGNILVGFNGFGVFNVGFNVNYIQNNGGIIFGPDSSGAINSFADPSPFLSNSSPSPISIGAQGVDQLAAYLFNSGEFTIPNNHSLTFDTPIISGGGSFALGSGDSLVLNADTVTGQTFTLGSNDKLTIGIDQLATIDLPASGTGPFTPESNPNKGDLLLGNFGGVIANFTSGDTIDVDTYLSSASAGTLSQNGSLVSVIEIDNGATLGVLRFDTAANAAAAVADNAIVLEAAPCFAAGTRISTARGEVAVEAIGVGDRVRALLGGGFAEVIWVGRREVDCADHAQPRKVRPVRVAAGAFGPGRPHSELFLSPDHAVYVNEVLIPVRYLINGSSVAQVPMDRVTYHHVELAVHDVLLAEGMPAESFLDMLDGSNYANRPGPIRLYPDFSARMWEAFGCARLIVMGPELDAARALVASFAHAQAAA